MRPSFMLTTIVLALALGIIAGASESRLLTRALVIGFVPAFWAAVHVLERLTSRKMWHLTAPYPYWRMHEQGETALPRPNVNRDPVGESRETDEGSTLPSAA
jgi:hypothetical protein